MANSIVRRINVLSNATKDIFWRDIIQKYVEKMVAGNPINQFSADIMVSKLFHTFLLLSGNDDKISKFAN